MSRLDRYVAAALMKGWVLVLLVVVSVFSLFALVVELDHVDNSYQVTDALMFVLLTVPRRALDLAPVIALLGSLIALASMARNNELMAMQAAGVTPARFTRSVAMAAALLVLSLGLSSEYVSAPLYLRAETQRMLARNGSGNLLAGRGLWSNDRRRFFNVRGLRDGYIPEGIDLYQFEPDGRLRLSIHASHAEVKGSREWTLIDVWRKQLLDGRLVTRHQERLEMGDFWSRDELPLLSFSTAAMSVTGLYRYAAHLQATGQRAGRFQLAFWQRITRPLAAGIMALLAIPACFGADPRRNQAFARRVTAGAVAGILFYLGTRIIYTSGMLLGFPPLLVALVPLVLLVSAGGVLFSRMRW
jgi:lipopolysaccharide export system permease protein